MTTRDLGSKLLTTNSITAAVLTATANGASVSNADAISTTHIVNVGVSGDTLSGTVYHTIKVQDSDDGSTWADSSDVEVYVATTKQSGATAVIDDPAEDDVSIRFAYYGSKEFTRTVDALTGTHTNGTPVSSTVVQETRYSVPV